MLKSQNSQILSSEQYINSLKNRSIKLFFDGKLIKEPTEHLVIRPSINAMAMTYELGNKEPDLALAYSSISKLHVSRFLHIAESGNDLILQNKMQRRLGQLTGTCFQRCVGMDALNSLHSTTFEIDEKYQTSYHQRFLSFVKEMHINNFVIGGAMTDVKGDRSKKPHEQHDQDFFVHVVSQNDEGIFITGAKAHQTGCINSHWLIVMPTMRMTEKDKKFAIVGALPVDTPGITYIYGRQSNDDRHLTSTFDTGNFLYAGQEALVIFENVFIPWKYVFMNGEYDFCSMLVDRFTNYHRRSYVCKSGVGDVIIGAGLTIADYNGVATVSHIRDKLAEVTQLNETIYGLGISSSFQAYQLKSGVWMCDDLLANVCKYNVTKYPYEIGRLIQDIAGGLLVTLPSENDFKNSETGPLLIKYLQGRSNTTTLDRVKILRLIENMTLGRNAVGYLTESMHGAGSPQAQKININRLMDVEFKKDLAKKIANISENEKSQTIESDFFKRVFNVKNNEN
jgi:4-hydroxybutyryl-CoA dehydratase/vinylacetyl-CoA-Delta-isomerase